MSKRNFVFSSVWATLLPNFMLVSQFERLFSLSSTLLEKMPQTRTSSIARTPNTFTSDVIITLLALKYFYNKVNWKSGFFLYKFYCRLLHDIDDD